MDLYLPLYSNFLNFFAEYDWETLTVVQCFTLGGDRRYDGSPQWTQRPRTHEESSGVDGDGYEFWSGGFSLTSGWRGRQGKKVRGGSSGFDGLQENGGTWSPGHTKTGSGQGQSGQRSKRVGGFRSRSETSHQGRRFNTGVTEEIPERSVRRRWDRTGTSWGLNMDKREGMVNTVPGTCTIFIQGTRSDCEVLLSDREKAGILEKLTTVVYGRWWGRTAVGY